jgi:hypothetical protein
MPVHYTPEETVRRGEELYERQIRPRVEAVNAGKYIVIDIETGDYQVGDDYMNLSRQMLAQRPGASLCVLRIGFPAVGRIGGQLTSGGESLCRTTT